LVGKHEGKRPLERPGHRCEYNIRRDLMEVGWEGTDRIHLNQDRDQGRALLNVVMNIQVS
jgi:hypothetical protein